MNEVTLFHDGSKPGTKKQWSIWLSDDGLVLTVEFGLVGHKLQRSIDVPSAIGKPDTKAWKSPVQATREKYDRLLKKKRGEGYQEDQTAVAPTSLDLSRLTKLFVPSKPIDDMTEAEKLRLGASGKLIIQRKRDGQRLLALHSTEGVVRLYSRRMEDLTDNLPRLAAAIRALGLPKGTVVDGELLVVDPDDNDDFKAVGSITKSLPKKAAIREGQLNVRYMPFDVLYVAGKEAYRKPYSERLDMLGVIIANDSSGLLLAPAVINMHLNDARALVKAGRWEGLVLWFKDQPTIVRNGGKPKRTGCAKDKPLNVGDFIAVSYELGNGSNRDVVGALNLKEVGPDGDWRSCGRVGGGFDDKTRREALTWKYPLVVKVEYDRQEPDTFNLRFPVFCGVHEDKTPDECIGRDLEGE